MVVKKYLKIFFITFLLIVVIFHLLKFFQKTKHVEKKFSSEKEIILENDSNFIKDVSYKAKDINGNEYIINAKEGKTNQINNEIIFLKYINAIIILKDGERIYIYSNYAEYNILNYNTVFNEDVMVNYLDNEIKGDYLEFSSEKNLLFMEKNIFFKNSDSIIKADAIEINIKSKDSKIYMYNNNKKINIQKFN